MKDLPSSPESERAVLDFLLSKQRQTPTDIAGLTEDDFYWSSHRILFRAIASLYEQGTTADMVTVTEALRTAGKLESVGGIAFITSLATNLLSLTSIDEYVAILREKRRLRYLARTFDELAKEACRGESAVEKLMERCQRAVGKTREIVQPILFDPDCQKKFEPPHIKFVTVPLCADFQTLICKTAASLAANPAASSLAIYSIGLCSCSEMSTWLRENLLQQGIDFATLRQFRVFLSDSALSIPNLFASLRCLRQSEGERLSIVVLDTWGVFQANTLPPVRVAQAVSGLRKLADELGLSVVLAVHLPSTEDFPKLGIMC